MKQRRTFRKRKPNEALNISGLKKHDHDLGGLLVETSPDALIAIAPDGTVLFWSAGAEATLGYTKEEAIGHLLHDLVVPPDLVEESRKATREASESGRPSGLLRTLHSIRAGAAGKAPSPHPPYPSVSCEI